MNNVPECNLYYIYIDTKIIGAIEQLVKYFQARVFTTNACIGILCKYYKEIEIPFQRIFERNGISFKFIKKNSDLQVENGKTIFYLFNAQSNCKLVANRSLTHIFVTHGESHKQASIKPIIRIYDYVISSGRVGIDRYLKSGIFSESDINGGKVITLGNTFIGNNNYCYDEKSEAMVYAPTWEGGVPNEDYCSISSDNTDKIITFCILNGINKVYVQPHPNIGHRIKSKIFDLKFLIKKIEESGLSVKIIDTTSKKERFSFFNKKNKKEEAHRELSVKYAVTDISAMEVQFHSKGIPCSVFAKKEIIQNLCIPNFLNNHYENRFIFDSSPLIKMNKPLDSTHQNYFFSYPEGIYQHTDYDKRISILCHKTTSERLSLSKELFLKY